MLPTALALHVVPAPSQPSSFLQNLSSLGARTVSSKVPALAQSDQRFSPRMIYCVCPPCSHTEEWTTQSQCLIPGTGICVALSPRRKFLWETQDCIPPPFIYSTIPP